MVNKLKKLVCIATVLQLMQMYDAAITGSNVVYTSNSIQQATGGIAVDHPAQATIYAKRGKLNVLIPFEFTIIPLSQNSIEPEIPSRGSTPVSGSIASQQNSNYYRTNQNVYRPVYYQPSSYPWYNNNYNSRGFYVPATPSVSSSYQPFVQPNQQYQNAYRPIIYQQQLPANTYRSQYYSPNSNVVYAPSYQQQARPWPQYNRPDRPNQPQQQQQQQQQPSQPNWSTNNTKPININEMNSTHPPNATTIPTQNNNNNQTTSVPTNPTTQTSTMTGPAPTLTTDVSTTTTTTTTETIPIAPKEQPAVPNSGNVDTQQDKPKPIDGAPVPAADQKDSTPDVKSNAPPNSGETTGNDNKVDGAANGHTDTAPTPIDTNNNNIEKTENINHEQQASVVNIPN